MGLLQDVSSNPGKKLRKIFMLPDHFFFLQNQLWQNSQFVTFQTTLLIGVYDFKGASLQADVFKGLRFSSLVFEVVRWRFLSIGFKMFIESRF